MDTRLQELEAHEREQDAMRLAIAMATHPRVGQSSHARCLDDELLRLCMPERSAWCYPSIGYDLIMGLELPDYEGFECHYDTFGQGNCGPSGIMYRLTFMKQFVVCTRDITWPRTDDVPSTVYYGPPLLKEDDKDHNATGRVIRILFTPYRMDRPKTLAVHVQFEDRGNDVDFMCRFYQTPGLKHKMALRDDLDLELLHA